MAIALRLLLVCLPPLCLGGCSYTPYLVRNLVAPPVDYVHNCRFQRELGRLADQAWREAASAHPDTTYSLAYMQGFHDGFVDYIDSNGSGEPHAVPPKHYRHPVLRTPQQQNEIEDWFVGFRHGAHVALDSRWRLQVVVPIGQPPLGTPIGFRQEIIPNPSVPAITPPPELPVLPPPRPLPSDPPQAGSHLLRSRLAPIGE